MSRHAQREKRWLVVTEDGSHATLGRHTDPAEHEIAEIGRRCDQLGLAAWLAVSEGRYHSRDRMSLMMVRPITEKVADWPEAERLWNERRAGEIR